MTPSTIDLQKTLERTVGRIEHVERKKCPYSSSYQIEELKVRLANGDVLEIIFKDLSPQAILENAHVKPDFLYNPLREIHTYDVALRRLSLDTAQCYAAVTEEGRYWLFLERVQGDHLWQTGDLEAWRNAARWLAKLHQQPVPATPLLRHDGEYYAHLWERATAVHPVLLTAQSAHDRAVKRLLELPSTFIHGEFYPSNVLVQGQRICAIDWEMAGCGPGLIDLATLISGKWDEKERSDFIAAYLGGAEASGEMMYALDCCRLHLAVRLLGWGRDWEPPAAHANDWRRHALDIAESLT